ncbi:hypothetical protein LPMP_333200 [Leishmania panamensis]|uniref:Flagellar attachment zone protein 1 conserved domain-containing protein n=1 Tax=Leishmania panamensis TaxID=5679 RepID=A0A088S034_LEIPA|nr:hypothetical protein LPMP_333200 [Leishmania panamensis]AIO01609.1 hypothetical protein LPMP_333200 [Leishmania panamensis]
MYMAHLYVCQSGPPRAYTAKNAGPGTYLDQVVDPERNGALRRLRSKVPTMKGIIRDHASAHSTQAAVVAWSGTSAQRWQSLTERCGFIETAEEAASQSAAVGAASLTSELEPVLQLSPHISLLPDSASGNAKSAASVIGNVKWPRPHFVPTMWARTHQAYGAALGGVAETAAVHHPYSDEQTFTASVGTRDAGAAHSSLISALVEAVKLLQQPLRSRPSPVVAPEPGAATPASFAFAQKLLIEYEKLSRDDLLIDFYVTYPTRPAVSSAPPLPPHSELPVAAACWRSPMRTVPPLATSTRLASEEQAIRGSENAKGVVSTGISSTGEWRRFRVVLPGALWSFVLRRHRHLLTRALRQDVESVLLPDEAVEIASLHASEVEIEVILTVRQPSGLQSQISTTLSCSFFAQTWEVYNVVSFFLSREVLPTLPRSVLWPTPLYEVTTSAGTATAHAALGEAASTLQPTTTPSLPLPAVLLKHQAPATSLTKASLPDITASGATSEVRRLLLLRVPLLFLAEDSGELQRLINAAPSQLRLALRRDAMCAASNVNNVQVQSWAVQPSGLYVELLLCCEDANGAHMALNAERAMDRCPFAETWDVIRAYATDLVPVTATVPNAMKRCASTPQHTPASERAEGSMMTTAHTEAKVMTAAAPQWEFPVRSASPFIEKVRQSWPQPEGAVLSGSTYAGSERYSVSTTDTVYRFVAGSGASLSGNYSEEGVNAGNAAVSSVAAISRHTPPVASLQSRITETMEAKRTPSVASAIAPRRVNTSAEVSHLGETNSAQPLLSTTFSTPKTQETGAPRANFATQTVQLPPRVCPAAEGVSLVTDVRERVAQALPASTEHSSEQLTPCTTVTKTTLVCPAAQVGKVLLPPCLPQPLLPTPRHSAQHPEAVGQESLASRIYSREEESATFLRNDKTRQTVQNNEEGGSFSRPHEPTVPLLRTAVVKQARAAPSAEISVTSSRHMTEDRQRSDQKRCSSLEINASAELITRGIGGQESNETLPPNGDTGLAMELEVEKADSDSTKGTCLSLVAGKKWQTLLAERPLLHQGTLQEDVHTWCGVPTTAMENVITCANKLHDEGMIALGMPLQSSSLAQKTETSTTDSATSSVFSSIMKQDPFVLRLRHMLDFDEQQAQRTRMGALRSSVASSTRSAAEATMHFRAIPSENVLDTSVKAVIISQLEAFSPLAASSASSPAQRAPAVHVELPGALQDRQRADDGDGVTQAALDDVEALRMTTIAHGSSLQVDFSVSSAALLGSRRPPPFRRELERWPPFHSSELCDAAALRAPARVHLRRFFVTPGLTEEKLVGQLEVARSLFLVETYAVLNTSDDVVEELHLSAHLTVDATVRVPNSHLIAEWSSALMEYDYPQLNELLHDLVARETSQAPPQVEANVQPEAMRRKRLLSSTTLLRPPTAGAALVAPKGGDISSHAVYVTGDLWREVIEQHADVLREALISDAIAVFSAVAVSVLRVITVPHGNDAVFTFLLQNHGTSSLRVVEDALQKCPFTEAWALYRRFRGTLRHPSYHQVLNDVYTVQLDGKVWDQVLMEHGDLLAETFVREVLECLRGSYGAAVPLGVGVTGIAAKPDGLTIAYDVASTELCFSVDRERVAHTVLAYPFLQLWKVYDTFILTHDLFKHTKRTHWLASHHLSTTCDVAEVPNQRRRSHIEPVLQMPLDLLESHPVTASLDDEVEKATSPTARSTQEMVKGPREYELKRLPALASVSAPPVSVVLPETAVVPRTRASLVDFTEAMENEHARVETRAENESLPLLPPQTFLSQRSQRREQPQRRHHHSAHAEHKWHDRQSRVKEPPTNTCQGGARRDAATESSTETEYEEGDEAVEDVPSWKSSEFVEQTAPVSPVSQLAGHHPPELSQSLQQSSPPLCSSAVAGLGVPDRAVAVATKAAPITCVPLTRSPLMTAPQSTAPVKRRPSSGAQPLPPCFRAPQNAASPAALSPSSVPIGVAVVSSQAPVNYTPLSPVKHTQRATSTLKKEYPSRPGPRTFGDEAACLPAQRTSPTRSRERLSSRPGSSTAGDEPLDALQPYTEAEGKAHGKLRAAHAHLPLTTLPPLLNVFSAAPIKVLDVRMTHSPMVAVPVTAPTASSIPTPSPPQQTVHHSGTRTVPRVLLQGSQAKNASRDSYSAPGLSSNGPTLSHDSCSPLMLTPTSCSFLHGNTATMRSRVTSALPVPPLQGGTMRSRHLTPFVVVSTEPSRSLQKLWDDVDSVEEAVRTRFPRMKRELMATTTAMLLDL